jgi:hypothetical protein
VISILSLYPPLIKTLPSVRGRRRRIHPLLTHAAAGGAESSVGRVVDFHVITIATTVADYLINVPEICFISESSGYFSGEAGAGKFNEKGLPNQAAPGQLR